MSSEREEQESETSIELESEPIGFILEPTQVEIASGYTLSVRYDEKEKPIVMVKTYGRVETAKILKRIKRIFPKAKIELRPTGSVTVVKKKKDKSSRKR
ncbi:MAG: hypothetical protein PVF96_00240 [Candidatus Bathyarchaeota archaeon]|jgi:hypothetical protein